MRRMYPFAKGTDTKTSKKPRYIETVLNLSATQRLEMHWDALICDGREIVERVIKAKRYILSMLKKSALHFAKEPGFLAVRSRIPVYI